MKEEQKDLLIYYIDILDSYNENNVVEKQDEKRNQLRKMYNNNPEIRKIMDELRKSSAYDRKVYLETKLKGSDNQRKLDIETKELNSGKLINIYYEKNLNKAVAFEGDIEGENKESEIKDKIRRENSELTLIPINELHKYEVIINSMSEDKKHNLMELIRNQEKFHLESVNLKEVFGISNKEYGNKIYESYYDKKENRYIIAEPNTVKYKENDSQEKVFDLEITEEDFSNIDEIIIGEIKESENREEVIENIKTYLQYPEGLNSLDNSQREYYEKLINKVKKQIVEKKKKKEKPKVLVYKKEDLKKAGFVDAILLSLITGFTAGVISTIMYFIIK